MHDLGNIELDGNTSNEGLGDDWNDVYADCADSDCSTGTTSAARQTFVDEEVEQDFTVFSGGLKDTQPLSNWTCRSSPVLGKNDILHAYAGVYDTAGDSVLYAGADRRTIEGTANFGIWLFQEAVGCDSEPNGGGATPFSGQHIDGDLLLVAEFDNGGAVATVNVYRWSDPDGIVENGDECLGGGLGDCSDEGEPFLQGANCGNSNPGDVVCGITNDTLAIDVPWRTESIGPNGFYEAAANLTLAITDQLGCFATSLIETRSSTSLTASLKDFVLLDVATCGSVTVEKVAENGSGSFDFSATPEINPGVGPFSLASGTSVAFNNVENKPYTIAETASPNEFWVLKDITCTAGSPVYDLVTGDVDITVGVADDIVCTFTNAFEPPAGTITIEKNCDSVDDGGQTFDFTLTGFGESTNADCADGSVTLACGGSVACTEIPADTDFSVVESAVSGWDLTNVGCVSDASSTCTPNTGAATASGTLASEGNVTATFTNTEDASIQVCKFTVPAGVGGDFAFTGTGGLGAFALADKECTDVTPVTPDEDYDISETVNEGFTLSDIDCTGSNWTSDGATVTVTPDPGEAVKCDFTNDQNPGFIRVCKQTVTTSSANPTFEFDLTGSGDADLPASTSLQDGECDFGPGDDNEVALSITSGYAVSEDAVSGWDTEVSCDSGQSDPSNITVASDETVTCTFTNTQRGSITVNKTAVGGNGVFGFTASYGDFSIDTSVSSQNVASNLEPGDYSVVEDTPPAGWDYNGVTCDDDDAGDDSANLVLDPGEDITCTFTNTAQGSITIVKNAVGDDGTFGFTRSFGADFNIDTTSGTGQQAYAGLTPGTYTVAEKDAGPGWDLTSESCTGDSTPDNINLTAGGAVTCTFTNTRLVPAIDIQKTPDTQSLPPEGGTALFTIKVTNTGEIDLENVEVTDAKAPNCDKLIGDLAVGQTFSYNCSLSGVLASFTNVADVIGDPIDGGDPVEDSDTAGVIVPIPPPEIIPVNSPWALLLLAMSILGFAWYRRPRNIG